MKYKTFQQKLDRFKSERVGFLVKSKEIADELAKIFEREYMKGTVGEKPAILLEDALTMNRGYPGVPYVIYEYFQGVKAMRYGTSDFENEPGENPELLEVTLEELKEYNRMNEQKPVTLEDKLALFKAGTHVLHTPTQEIFDKLMVELEKRGYKWQNGDKPADNPKEWIALSSGTCILAKPKGICKAPKYFYEEEGIEVLTLTPEDFSTPQVITITSDGYHRVTAESNGITAEALCNPKDEFKLTKGVHLAAQRLLEKLAESPKETNEKIEEDTGFHKGDIVEVVKNVTEFTPDPVGLQGIVTVDSDRPGMGTKVKLPTHNEPLYFYKSELKLIRRGNC